MSVDAPSAPRKEPPAMLKAGHRMQIVAPSISGQARFTRFCSSICSCRLKLGGQRRMNSNLRGKHNSRSHSAKIFSLDTKQARTVCHQKTYVAIKDKVTTFDGHALAVASSKIVEDKV